MRAVNPRAVLLLLMCCLAPIATGAGESGPERYWAQIRQLFPEATELRRDEGGTPSAAVISADGVLGHVFLTNDVLSIPAYSGKPINTLVGFGVDGHLRGIRIVEHEEPILVIGVSQADLEDYASQYAGIRVTDEIKIGGDAKPGRAVIDGISGATITAMVINRTVSKGVKDVSRDRGVLVARSDAEMSASAVPETPLWREIWSGKRWTIAILSLALFGLLVILLFQDWLARRPSALLRIRLVFLLFTFFFVGVYAMGQLSIVNVLTFSSAILQGFRWESFLMDPVLFLLWSFVALTLLLWGRGVYCGWLCPFGALQELVYRVARRLGVPEWEPPGVLHERLLAIKYVVLLGLFGLSLQSLAQAELFAEVEPFKTAFALRFVRDWPFVVYAVLILVVGMFLRKAFCRYLCPLGAALTFPSRFRIFDWLRRRKECGRPCQTCYRECEVRAIQPTGEINEVECHYCLDCQVTYWDPYKCPPLVEQRKKAERRDRISRARR